MNPRRPRRPIMVGGRLLPIVASLLILVGLMAVRLDVRGDDTGELSKEKAEKVHPAKPLYSPYAGRNYPTRPYFGETHLHTAASMDAGAFGARLTPRDAYRFARGEEVTASSGQRGKLSRPLTVGGHIHRVLLLADALFVAGRVDGAEERAGQALDFARAHGERRMEAWVCRLLGRIASHRGPPDVEAAEGHYRHALALAHEVGMRPLVAHCHVNLAELYHRTGDRAKADEYLTIATTMYRDMGMDFWLAQAQAALEPLASNAGSSGQAVHRRGA
jgi:tetratricopeptide (TPR) repeat protein